MTEQYTKADHRCIWEMASRLLLPARPLTAEEAVRYSDLREKASKLVASSVGLTARGRLIFEWRLHAGGKNGEDAPTQNHIRGLAFGGPFALTSKEKRLDTLLSMAIENIRDAIAKPGEKRYVRVTRFSTGKVDDPTAVDAIGGKMPIDALVRARVLRDDTTEYCHREGRQEKGSPNNVNVLIEVFEMAETEVPHPDPVDVPMPPRKKIRGPIAQHIVDASGGDAPKKPRAPRRRSTGIVQAILGTPAPTGGTTR